MKGLTQEKGISLSLIGVAVVVNFINNAVFYNAINPFYEIASFFAYLAGLLGITIWPLGIAAIVSILLVLPKKHKHNYIFYFAIIFLILSVFSLIISVSNSAYESGGL